VDDYTSGNAWVDRVSNIEVNVPGSASFHDGYVHLSGTAITAPLQTNPTLMQSATYVIRLRVPTIPSNQGWVMSQFPDYGWSRALSISDSRLGTVGQTPGYFATGLGTDPNEKLIIGGRRETDADHNPELIDISDVLVFNRALNTDEINLITYTLSEARRILQNVSRKSFQSVG